MKTLAIINQKGGVGKTTTAVNLGHALALRGLRVTLVDLDPQGHLAPCLGLFRAPARGIDRALLHDDPPAAHAVATRELLSLIPAGATLGEVERIEGGVGRARRLREAFARGMPESDWVIVDCPPSAGLLVMNALLAVDRVLIPVAGDYLSLTGLARLLRTLGRVDAMRGRPLVREVFMSRHQPRRRLAREVRQRIEDHLGRHLLDAAIREAAVLAECAGAGRTIFEYRPRSRSAEEFAELAAELVQREEHRDEPTTRDVA